MPWLCAGPLPVPEGWAEYVNGAETEAELAAGLSHPNIVGIHDRGEQDGQFWISMDYVAGTDAGRLLRQNYPAGMPIDEVVSIITKSSAERLGLKAGSSAYAVIKASDVIVAVD